MLKIKDIKKEIDKTINKKEKFIVQKLNTPVKIQDFLDKIPFNFEKEVETYMSPRRVLEMKKMHCFEGALFACLCLRYHGYDNYLMDLKTKNIKKDSDHTLCIFKVGKYFGAISKTNHSVLRWRDPIYSSYRELAMSYFHEYFLDSGEKTLLSFSKPFDVWKRFGTKWITETEDLDSLAESLDVSPHTDFVPLESKRFIKKAGKTEIKGASIVEWQKNKNKV